MRVTFLAAALSLGFSRASANVICDSKRDLGDLDDPIEACIEDFCTTGIEAGGTNPDQCGSILLTFTLFDQHVLADADDCIAHFDNIVDQCGSQGGVALGVEAMYEAHAVDGEMEERGLSNNVGEDSSLVARGRSRGGRTKSKKPKKSKKKGKKGPCKPKKGKKGKGGKGPTQPKKGKKTIRELLESFVPARLLPRAPPTPSSNGKGKEPAKDAGKACEIEDTHYTRKALHKNVLHYQFDTSKGWKTGVTDERAKKVMGEIQDDAVLNVVAITGPSKSYCIGENPGPGSRPKEIAVQAAASGGNCLLTNGKFFIMGATQGLEWQRGQSPVNDVTEYNKYSVGFTSTTDKQVAIPKDYEGYYEEFKGADGSSMMCGPSLKEPLDWKRPELRYFCRPKPELKTSKATGSSMPDWVRSVYTALPGSLAHADQKNERLVTVILSDHLKYVFAYTAKNRFVGGVNLNRMRGIIDRYLKEFPNAPGISAAQQALNMDGGGSIYVN